MNLLTLLIAILAILINFVNCDVYSSTDELTKLLSNKKDLIDHLKIFVSDIDREMAKLKSKLTSIEAEHKLMSKNPQNYVENPLNAFILIKTLSHDIEIIRSGFREPLKALETAIKPIELQPIDFDGAVSGLLRLQQVYRLKSKDLAQGVVGGKKVRKWLSPDELFTLGIELIPQNRVKASNFLRFSLKRADEDTKDEFLGKILSTFGAFGEFKEEIQQIEDDTATKLNKTVEFLSKMTPLKPGGLSAFDQVRIEREESRDAMFSRACRGLRNQNPTETSQLTCNFHSPSPFTKIAPFKVEIMNKLPYVAVVYDILSDDEIKVFKSFKSDQLKTVDMFDATPTTASKVNVAKMKDISDDEHVVFETLTQRIGDLSGLKMDNSQPIKIQNYGIGGNYDLHFDFINDWDKRNITETGNRIASTLLFLSDVEKGGFTVFPFLKIHVPPKKGSAIFWHNLSSSGHKEYLTMHGGCPVIIGSKWIANKLIYEFGQERTRPCELEPRETNDYYWGYYDT